MPSVPSLQEKVAVSSLLFVSCVCTHKQFVYEPKHCYCSKTVCTGASLVAQWLRICLPMQGTWVRALVWEDPT